MGVRSRLSCIGLFARLAYYFKQFPRSVWGIVNLVSEKGQFGVFDLIFVSSPLVLVFVGVLRKGLISISFRLSPILI